MIDVKNPRNEEQEVVFFQVNANGQVAMLNVEKFVAVSDEEQFKHQYMEYDSFDYSDDISGKVFHFSIRFKLNELSENKKKAITTFVRDSVDENTDINTIAIVIHTIFGCGVAIQGCKEETKMLLFISADILTNTN